MSQSSKRIFVSKQENLRPIENRRQKVVRFSHPRPEFSSRIDSWIDFTANDLLPVFKICRNLRKRDAVDDQQINVASLLLLPSRNRTVDKSYLDISLERRQGATESIADT